MHMPYCTPRNSRPAKRQRCRLHCILLTLAVCTAAPHAQAQQPAMPGGAAVQLPPELMRQMETAGGPAAEGLARLKRMSDPNAGKRPGDQKLSCDQIKAAFEETNRQYTIQSEKQDAANAAVEAEAAKLQAESSSPAAVAKGFIVGLAAVGAQAVGAGDAFNEKLKADLLANEARKQAVLNQSGQEAEATTALADRGQALMNLGKAKGCKGIPTPQQNKDLP
jgi:hypothetical protein